jgi:hypothetical protein
LSHWAVPTDVSVSIGSQLSRLSATTYSNFAPGESPNSEYCQFNREATNGIVQYLLGTIVA